MKIRWSPTAGSDIYKLHHYLSIQSPRLADLIVKSIIRTIESIPKNPLVGRIVSDYKNKNIRERFYKSYRIIYLIKKDVIEVLVIQHTSRLLPESFKITN